MGNPGRNDACPCGSGKKYKKCCLSKDEEKADRQRQTVQNIIMGIAGPVYAERAERLRERVPQILELKISLAYIFDEGYETTDVYAAVRINDRMTLFDLHGCIQNCFHLDNDHMFSFYMNDKLWDKQHEYSGNPFGEHVRSKVSVDYSRPAINAELGAFYLEKNDRFVYLFDYGDKITYGIEVTGNFDCGEEKDFTYSIIKKHGKPPKQYAR